MVGYYGGRAIVAPIALGAFTTGFVSILVAYLLRLQVAFTRKGEAVNTPGKWEVSKSVSKRVLAVCGLPLFFFAQGVMIGLEWRIAKGGAAPVLAAAAALLMIGACAYAAGYRVRVLQWTGLGNGS